MNKKIIFIFGCQRSGTTATINGLRKNENIFVFNEINEVVYKKTIEKYKIRLKAKNELVNIFDNINEENIVLKPLVESQNTLEFLDDFPLAISFWLIREYKSVAKSMMKKWGRRIGYEFVEKSLGNETWQSEKIEDLKPLINYMKTQIFSNWDYACFFWYVRNYHFYKQKLETNKKVLLLHYEHLVSDVNYLQKRFNKFKLALTITGDFYHQSSVKKVSEVKLHPLVEQLCSDMWSRLNTDHNRSLV